MAESKIVTKPKLFQCFYDNPGYQTKDTLKK